MSNYNGWKNWETWNCNLHFDNAFSEEAQEVFDKLDSCWNWKESDLKDEFVKILASYIENNIDSCADEFIGDRNCSFFADIINSSLRDIDYRQIASHYWDSLDFTEYRKYNGNDE